MFSKALFKKSCRTNGMLWLMVTVAVCFMLSCVMLITGRGSISSTKKAIQDTIIDQEIESFIEKQAISYYEIGSSAMAYFDEAIPGGIPKYPGICPSERNSGGTGGRHCGAESLRVGSESIAGPIYPATYVVAWI